MIASHLKEKSLFKEQAYFEGSWQSAISGKTMPIYNPANNAQIGTVPYMGQAETQRAIKFAALAFPSWRAKTATERSRILKKWHALILENLEDLAIIMTLEQGKPLVESRSEINYAASFVEWFAEEAKRLYGDIIPATLPNRQFLVHKEPVGIVGAITPWNFPSAMITRKVAPALAVGCPIIVKPAPTTPYSALALMELGIRAGIPSGIFQVITGDAQAIGLELTYHPDVRKITFTGSTAVGKKLMAQCAEGVKKISLELGGNAPFIVFDDADISAAVKGAIICKFRNAGQTCVCANRIYVQENVYEVFMGQFIEAIKNLKVGEGLSPETQIGPLINEAAILKVESLVQDAQVQGAQCLLGGKRHTLGAHFFEPTVLTGVTSQMAIHNTEIFGPVACVSIFKTEEEIIECANNTPYGLAAYFYTQNMARIMKISQKLDYGIIGINEGIISSEAVPFGGMKESGIGREGSKYGLDEYVEIKYLCLGGL